MENNKKLHTFGTALLSLKGKAGYPHLLPVKYLIKEDKMYISKRGEDFGLPDMEFGSLISYSIIGYEQIIPIQLEDSPDSLLILDLAKDVEPSDMEVTYNSFINKFAEGRVEVGVGTLKEYEGYGNIVMIHVERSSREYNTDL